MGVVKFDKNFFFFETVPRWVFFVCLWYFIVEDRTTLLSTGKLCLMKETKRFESEPR